MLANPSSILLQSGKAKAPQWKRHYLAIAIGALSFVLPLTQISAANQHSPDASNKTLAEQQIRSRADLEYGTVLFQFYQQDYFHGLIEQEYAFAINNAYAKNHRGQLLKGGMSLSYGMADAAQGIFDQLLESNTSEEVRNRAWYYLAKLYHASSQPEKSYAALENIHGNIPNDLHLDYHYLATLVRNDGEHLDVMQRAVDQIPTTTPQYPYLVFNLGVSFLQGGDQDSAISNLNAVVNYADNSEELQVLADRARHGLAQLAIKDQRLFDAWGHLQNIRTTGLYSNRALLAYAWAAIGQKQYEAALPALQLLSERSITLPEVQECKVLLGHLYEQQGSMTRALKSHLNAEKEFQRGIEKVAEARRIIDMRDVPREFIANLDAIVDDTDWLGAQPSVDYTKLTPFLVDLMASNAFHQVLGELAELYAIRDNLNYWANQSDQHTLILDNADEKIFDDDMKTLIGESRELHARLSNQRQELNLMTLTLDPDEQARFKALMENSSKELALLSDTIKQLQKNSEPYRQPPEHRPMVVGHHQRIVEAQAQTKHYIDLLEPVMRNLVKVELDKHDERMHYYLAQTRLAKARLYDTALTNINKPSFDGPSSSTGDAQ